MRTSMISSGSRLAVDRATESSVIRASRSRTGVSLDGAAMGFLSGWVGLLTGFRAVLAQGLELARSPGLVEEGLERAVEAEDREPALALRRLDPVLLRAVRGSLGAEREGRGAVGVGGRRRCREGLAPGTGEA